jgi:LPXTG-motif cell wall-anchored protein
MSIRRLRRLGACMAVAGLAVLPAAGTAAAEDPYTQPAAEVLGTQLNRSAPAAVAGTQQSRGLPVTGADIAELAAVGLAAVATGSLLVRRSRRTV